MLNQKVIAFVSLVTFSREWAAYFEKKNDKMLPPKPLNVDTSPPSSPEEENGNETIMVPSELAPPELSNKLSCFKF
jgi:hypothetical protein